MVPSLLLVLALAAHAESFEDAVVVPFDAVREPPPPPPPGPPVPAIVDEAVVTLEVDAESRLRIVCTITMLASGWVDLPVAGADVAVTTATLDGRPARLGRVGDGARRLVAELSAGRHVVEVVGTVDTASARLDLVAPPATRTRLQAVADGLDFTVQGGVPAGDGAWDLARAGVPRVRPGAEPLQDRIQVSWVPSRPPPPRPRVVTVESAVGLQAEEGGVEGRAQLRYHVVDGTIDRLRVRIPGGVEQVEVEGQGVAGHAISGDVVEIRLGEAVEGRVVVDLRWRGRAPGPAVGPAPVPVALDGRGSTYVTLSRGDDSLLVPTPVKALEAVPAFTVPAWARGLVPGRPLVVYRSDNAERAELSWQRLAWSPVDAPPTLVDEARYTVVHAEHGRVHVRAAWQVRNDRNPFLGVTLPPGWEAVGLRVAGRTAEPVRAADGRLLVPLEKSVETLDGLVAFPVELMLVGDEASWTRRGERALQTPAVDAPVAYARWEVRLPAGVEDRKVEGVPTLVERWTPDDASMVIGRATGATLEEDEEEHLRDDSEDLTFARKKKGKKAAKDEAAAGGGKRAGASEDGKAVSQEYWNRAYSAYKDNRFDEAEALLEKSLAYDPSNSSAASLQQNVDVLQGDATVSADQQAQANRVRELARARTGDLEIEQARRERALEEKVRAGDRDAARKEAEALLQLTSQLAAVEQTEAVEQKSRLDSYRQQLAELDGREDPDMAGAANIEDALSEGGFEGSVSGGIGGLIGTKGGQVGSGGLGARGSGLGGGGTAEGLGGLGTSARAARKREADKARNEEAFGFDGDFGGRDAVATGKPDKKPKPPDTGATASVTTGFDFEDLEVSGELVQPDGAVLFDRRDRAFVPLAPSGKDAVAVDDEMGAGFATLDPEPAQEVFFQDAGVAADDAPVAAPAAAAPPPPPPPPPRAAPEPPMEEIAEEEPMDAPDADEDVLVREFLERVPAGRSYEATVETVSMASVRRRRLRWPDLSRPDPPPPPEPEAFPLAPPADAAFPRGPVAEVLPPIDTPPPPPSVDVAVAPAFPVTGGPGSGLERPVRAAAAPAFPLDTPPPPPAPFGLDVPGGITASTLSLSLPETEAGLLLEQRLLAPGEPLSLSLRYRARPQR